MKKRELTMSDVVTYEVRGRKAYLTLNRPDRLNAITDEVARRLKELVDRANDDPAVEYHRPSGCRASLQRGVRPQAICRIW
ncbi:hypothetical protein [Nocardia sp. CA-120079]|uniref:hypothetical protein n=1 Tax=Nocardia sp. CA-120079 TaxID=3239974 RepID=UPI003D983BDE